MIFFSNLDGTLLPIPSQVNQNSFDANKIYLIAPYNTGYSVDATFILPDGTITTPYIMSVSVDLPLNIGEKPYYVRELSIDKVITQFYGNATIQFAFYSGGKKLSTQAGVFTINRGVAGIVDSVDFSEELYNTIMNALSSVLTAINNTVTPYGCCSVFEIIPNGEVTIHTTFNAIDWGDGTFSYTNNKHTYENQNAKIVRLYTGSSIRGGTLLFSNASVNIAKFGFGISLINTRINDLNITEIHFPETLKTITGELCTAPQLDKLVFKGELPFSSYSTAFGNTTPQVLVLQEYMTAYENAGTPNVKAYAYVGESGGGGTTVTVGGVAQATWNADTKLDKFTESSGVRRYYGADKNGNQFMGYVSELDSQALAGWLVSYRGKNDGTYNLDGLGNPGYLLTATPLNPFHCANKKYVDENTLHKHLVTFATSEISPPRRATIFSKQLTAFTSVADFPKNETFVAFNDTDEYADICVIIGTAMYYLRTQASGTTYDSVDINSLYFESDTVI